MRPVTGRRSRGIEAGAIRGGAARTNRGGAGSANRHGSGASERRLKEFQYQPKAAPQHGGPRMGRWVRFLVCIATLQAISALMVLFARSGGGWPLQLHVARGQVAADRSAAAAALRTCLQSLSRVNGFDPKSVLVAQAGPGDASRRAAEKEFSVSWIGPRAENLAREKADVANANVDDSAGTLRNRAV
mmetsp:Transcript_96861/g.273768  ORF Transcript_96861/g.273768 Transcript_96861/m.273768 type:complete len:188 (-) Transcript_96861:138-701(-)